MMLSRQELITRHGIYTTFRPLSLHQVFTRCVHAYIQALYSFIKCVRSVCMHASFIKAGINHTAQYNMTFRPLSLHQVCARCMHAYKLYIVSSSVCEVFVCIQALL